MTSNTIVQSTAATSTFSTVRFHDMNYIYAFLMNRQLQCPHYGLEKKNMDVPLCFVSSLCSTSDYNIAT